MYNIGQSSTTKLCSWIPGPVESLKYSRGATLAVGSEAGTQKHGLKENNSHMCGQGHPGVDEVTRVSRKKEVSIRKITVFHNLAMTHRGKGMTRDSTRSPR